MSSEIIPPITERIKYLIELFAGGSVRKFSGLLRNVSQQKLNRIFNIDTRTGKYPLVTTDVLVAITEMFVNVNPRWLLTGVGDIQVRNLAYTPNETGDLPNAAEAIPTYSPTHKIENVPPTHGVFVPPTVPPTSDVCLLCEEKERVIAHQKKIIELLEDANWQMKNKLGECCPDNDKKRGTG